MHGIAPSSSGAIVKICACPPAASTNLPSNSAEGSRINCGGWTPRRAGLINGPSKWIPNTSARESPARCCTPIYLEIPSALLQITSASAVTVVATKEVVPWLPIILQTAAKAEFRAFHHIVAACAMDVHIQESWRGRLIQRLNFLSLLQGATCCCAAPPLRLRRRETGFPASWISVVEVIARFT